MPKLKSLLRSALGCAAALTLAAPVAAQADDFYKGQTITLIVGISPGGGYDQYGRLLSRHLAQHIPGNPTIIVRNLPGAGSLTSVINLQKIAPTDGTTIGTFNAGLLNDSITEGDKARVKFNQFAWVGSLTRELRVCVSWKDSPVKSWDDLARGKATVFGAPGPNSNAANGIAEIRSLFNLKNLKTITAYPGISETNLAVERGEVDGTCASWIALPERWIKDKNVNILVRLTPGTISDIPSSVKYIGDMADTPDKKSLVGALTASGELARPFIMSDKVPKDRVEIIRKAFAETMKDPDFIADAEKSKLLIDPIVGDKAQGIVDKLYSMSPALLEQMKAILKS